MWKTHVDKFYHGSSKKKPTALELGGKKWTFPFLDILPCDLQQPKQGFLILLDIIEASGEPVPFLSDGIQLNRCQLPHNQRQVRILPQY